MPVMCRFVGVVGGVRSRAAEAGDTPSIHESTSVLTAACATRHAGVRPVMVFSPLTHRGRTVPMQCITQRGSMRHTRKALSHPLPRHPAGERAQTGHGVARGGSRTASQQPCLSPWSSTLRPKRVSPSAGNRERPTSPVLRDGGASGADGVHSGPELGVLAACPHAHPIHYD
jgi:hypothetical protein